MVPSPFSRVVDEDDLLEDDEDDDDRDGDGGREEEKEEEVDGRVAETDAEDEVEEDGTDIKRRVCAREASETVLWFYDLIRQS